MSHVTSSGARQAWQKRAVARLVWPQLGQKARATCGSTAVRSAADDDTSAGAASAPTTALNVRPQRWQKRAPTRNVALQASQTGSKSTRNGRLQEPQKVAPGRLSAEQFGQFMTSHRD
jgi:hypothetical protein